MKTTTDIDRHIGQRLRLQRMNLGMSQETLGASVDLTFQQIQKYEKGVNRVSAARLFEFSKVLGVDVTYFYEGLSQHRARAAGMEESANLDDFLDFVSSAEGFGLMHSFNKIRNKSVRQSIIDMTRAMERSQPRRPGRPRR